MQRQVGELKARKLNRQETLEEERKAKLPANWESRRARAEWELEREHKKKECEKRGEDYNRIQALEVSAENADRWERKRKKKNPDPGFSGECGRSINARRGREKSDTLYPMAHSLRHGTHEPSGEGVDRMVEDLEKQIEKRSKFSRRRRFHDDADIDYINERNANFNRKAARFYGAYTAEIRQNLERGTAV
uniref:Pre-mRNA-splicing factor SYF2 n=1 Tax=Eptatretus burgeri TaxID=7764 RepID=A0A8C4R6S2_EPTBU